MKGMGRELHELSQKGQAYMRLDICEDTDPSGESGGESAKATVHPKCSGTGLSAFVAFYSLE